MSRLLPPQPLRNILAAISTPAAMANIEEEKTFLGIHYVVITPPVPRRLKKRAGKRYWRQKRVIRKIGQQAGADFVFLPGKNI